MLSQQISKNRLKQITRCDERTERKEHGISLSPIETRDAILKENITNALWKDDILRAMDYYEISVRVKNGVATLDGYITSSSSQNRVKNAIHPIPGVVEIINNLVLDDKLTLEIASALGGLEHEYNCKFFTGVTHGVVFLAGTVRDEKTRLLAEKCASANSNTRGVINKIKILGNNLKGPDLPFLQPVIGETIYFLDWVSGVVKQVIMNPDSRLVIAMIIQGKFSNQPNKPKPQVEGYLPIKERLIVIPMSTVRHLTKVSGFLHIESRERDRYTDFDPNQFIAPYIEWTPPYPYCPDDVLFPLKYYENDK